MQVEQDQRAPNHQKPQPVSYNPHLRTNQSLTRNRYPHKFHVNTRLPHFLLDHKDLKRGEELKDVEVRTGLRVMSIRSSSNALRFYVCKSEGLTVQVMCQLQNAKGDVPFEKQHENIQRGGL